MSSIYILIPAYNEEKVIGSVISDLKSHGYNNILIVDDGSKDKTVEITEQAGVEVLKHLINRGQGASLQTGFQYLAREYSPDVIVTFDADGQHQTKDIASLIQPILNNTADIVLGSRFLDTKCHIPTTRRIILRLGILFTNTISQIRLTDTHNGLRALNSKAYNSIIITHRGMEHASDIIDEITKNKLRYKEVPVTITYSEYSKNKGQKNLDFIKLGIKILINKLK
ncbi:MAG: glycosyltransferase family 2 protein [Candidatus Moraniibacteriota bacterium]